MPEGLTSPTNATKAQALAVVNSAVALLAAFGFDLSGEQTAAITVFVNALFALWVGVTYKQSPKRIPEGP